MANILIEVDDALRRERVEKLWNRHGGLIIGAILLIIVGTAAISGYRIWDKNAKTTQTEQLLAAIDDGPERLITTGETLRPGLKTLALWRAAGAYLEQGKKPQAMETYASILKDSKTPTDFRHLAAYQIARLTAQDDPVMGLALLEKSANDINNPWSLIARLDVAVLQARHRKDYRTARDHLAVILKETDLPASLERKARSLDMLYAIEAPETLKPVAAQPARKQQNQTSPADTNQPESNKDEPGQQEGAQ